MDEEQNILLRLTPGIDPHTYAQISTGQIDSKFGSSIDNGDAEVLIQKILKMPHIQLRGFHCHVGSQVFTEDVFEKAVEKMLFFIAKIKDLYGLETEILNLGGGFGVRYVETDPVCVRI